MPDHAVLVYVKQLPDEDMALDEIEDPLIEAIEQAEVGEFDGNGIGPDGAELYMYGPDGEAFGRSWSRSCGPRPWVRARTPSSGSANPVPDSVGLTWLDDRPGTDDG